MSYLPIESYGLIGNMRSAALVGTNGSIDWFCFPHFDSPSLFAAMLDDKKGGHFQIEPASGEYHPKQFYWPDTNILITRFHCQNGIVEVTDFMPVGEGVRDEKDYHLIRIVKGIHGKVKMKMTCRPAFDYARATHEVSINDKGASFHNDQLSMALSSSVPLSRDDQAAISEFALQQEEVAVFVFHKIGSGEGCSFQLSREEAEGSFRNTIRFWRDWIAQSQYKGRWRETVSRSALILKLLTFEPTGAIVAAPTCSLPEHIGGERNWDYRYTWVRDAAFTIYAFMRIGFTTEAAQFMNWIMERSDGPDDTGALQIMYGIDGRKDLSEEHLDHLEGYRGSSPVRIGNGAFNQLQLDIYGELMDSVYLYNKYGSPISYEQWQIMTKHIEWVCRNWQKEDEGIWEVRSGRQHFVYSKMMCWVALDRAIRLARKRSLPADLARWTEVRNDIYREIMEKGWSDKLQAFVQYYDSETLDAANLMMPLVFFLSPTDPMMLKTLEASMQSPDQGGLLTNSLVYRYNNQHVSDGLDGKEGTFNICTFWMVEALTRAGKNDPKKLEEAHLMFEQMLGYANHLGIFSEQIGLRGEALGNTPQAFTHLALISAAYNLDKALG
ncbi:glycoside hydrolase family 15 protein [Flavilitoribacter nigricans]|uniref:Glucoamylase n=1 Tax=Flavilitoribacter nigricans (strain ATCC 23147 / DSM 23189 / NBRC 102662 / NCIMB 1420 / SS-2) TaxID=1122177 RepID=A0A2D0MZQ2_FLAN2|nr:glycoside hydrolase family 15 protein [Flavilitoribacter nigricans]PHN01725.1 glucoamylase [Flavilitoribacter nigricans DSM 23189 = NBRC 102662]